MVTVVLLSLAVSLDGFAVGFAYGVRRLKVPYFSLLIISMLSALFMALSLSMGKLISLIFNIDVVSIFGGTILLLIGVGMIFEVLLVKSNFEREFEDTSSKRLKFCYMKKMLREPVKADIDHSGSISSGEAVLLGLALAMDAFGTGIGAAMAGLPLLATSLTVGLIKFILVKSGVVLGKRFCSGFSVEKASCAAGGILIFLGILTFWS